MKMFGSAVWKHLDLPNTNDCFKYSTADDAQISSVMEIYCLACEPIVYSCLAEVDPEITWILLLLSSGLSLFVLPSKNSAACHTTLTNYFLSNTFSMQPISHIFTADVLQYIPPCVFWGHEVTHTEALK